MANEGDRPMADAMPDDVAALDGWAPARPRLDPQRAKVPARGITINIDEDVLAIFKAEARRGSPGRTRLPVWSAAGSPRPGSSCRPGSHSWRPSCSRTQTG